MAKSSDTTTSDAPQATTSDAPQATTSDAPQATVSEGSTRETQQKLADKGYSIAVNDIWTQETTDAVRNFQVNNGLDPTGVVGRGDDPTWKALSG